jgi:archaellum component FlaC
MEDPAYTQIYQQLQLIQQYLDGTTAQLGSMTANIDNMGKNFNESMAALSENMRLIIEVIKKGRTNLVETVDDLSKQINEKIQNLYEEKILESITQEELKSISKLKEINAVVTDNLYMQQMMAIIQSVREMVGRILAMKMRSAPNRSPENV